MKRWLSIDGQNVPPRIVYTEEKAVHNVMNTCSFIIYELNYGSSIGNSSKRVLNIILIHVMLIINCYY